MPILIFLYIHAHHLVSRELASVTSFMTKFMVLGIVAVQKRPGSKMLWSCAKYHASKV
jgi:hypothetical protein